MQRCETTRNLPALNQGEAARVRLGPEDFNPSGGQMDRATFDAEVQRLRSERPEVKSWEVPSSWLSTMFMAIDVTFRRGESAIDSFRCLLRMIAYSETEQLDWDALCEIGRELQDAGQQVPGPLNDWVVDAACDGTRERPDRRRPRPRKRRRNLNMRDGWIRAAVRDLVQRPDLSATRSRDGPARCCFEANSACDIVGAAIHTGYKNVERVWGKRRRRARYLTDGPRPGERYKVVVDSFGEGDDWHWLA